MTADDWLRVFRDCGSAIRSSLEGLSGTEAGRAELSRGAGGDITVEMDRRAEEAAFAVLDRQAAEGMKFTAISEEVGRQDRGAEYPLVFVDPIDGSLNAKQGIPLYSAMLSVLDGPNAEDILCGYVINLVSGEEWWATRGGGAFRNGRPLQPLQPRGGGRLELLGLESSPHSVLAARGLIERAEKVRILGSMAISIAHTAAGSFDAFCSPIHARFFDMSASLLIAWEAGAVATDLEGEDLRGRKVGLEERTTLLIGTNPEMHELALKLWRETDPDSLD